MITHTFKKQISVDFMPAHYDETRLQEVAGDVGSELNLTDEQTTNLLDILVDLVDQDDVCQTPIFNQPEQIVQATGLVNKQPTLSAVRRLMFVIFGEMLLDDLADYSTDDRLKSLVLIDFEVDETGVKAVFESTSDGMQGDEIADYLAGQLSDGWGENGTPERELDVDIRTMSASVIDETCRYGDVLTSPLNVSRFCTLDLGLDGDTPLFDSSNKLTISDERLVPLTRKPNKINVQAWV